jgi:hypothetical protein
VRPEFDRDIPWDVVSCDVACDTDQGAVPGAVAGPVAGRSSSSLGSFILGDPP